MKQPLDRRTLLRLGAIIPGAAALMAAPAAATPDAACEPTRGDNKGPFYLSGAPRRTVIAGASEPGERLRVEGRVLAADCKTPLTGALVDVWQADASGEYHGKGEDFRLRGQILTNARRRVLVRDRHARALSPGRRSAPGPHPLHGLQPGVRAGHHAALFRRGPQARGERPVRARLRLQRSPEDHPAGEGQGRDLPPGAST